MLTLVLLRHGQSIWNAENLFTGWTDVNLSARGEDEARRAGELLAVEPDLDLTIVHTSLLTRAIQTANLSLSVADRSWLPVRRSWRLNERHYGALQGLSKAAATAEYGEKQVKEWRRSYNALPPALPSGDKRLAIRDPRYRDLSAEALPTAECLKDVVRRVLPYWQDSILPDLVDSGVRRGAVLVVAHGNSLRALRKHIDGASDEEIVDLDIPTGFPYRYRFADDLSIQEAGYLGDPATAKAAVEAVAHEAG